MHARSRNGGSRRTRLLVAVLAALAGVAGGLTAAAVAPAVAQGPPKPEAAGAAQSLAAAVPAGGEVATAPDGEPVTFVGTPPGGSIAVSGGPANPQDAAQAFVEQYGPAFGEPSPERDLQVDRATAMGAGGESVHYQQLEGGVPVVAGEMTVQVSANAKVRSAAGELSVGAPVDTAPAVGADAARDAALAGVATEAGVEASVLAADEPELWVYDPSLIGEPGNGRWLVWRLEVRSDRAPVRFDVLIDAGTGEVALLLEGIHEAKNRQVCDDQNVLGRSYTCPNASAPVVRAEGQAATGISEVDKAYDLSGATYDFYFGLFGRDSINGAGMALKSTVRHCPTGDACPYENAFWDGAQMVYGDTFAGADDVVGHELTHGVTEFESNLVYANQSGAINESLSDVFGEFVDLTFDSSFDDDSAAARWLMGEDLPIGEIRDMENPPAFGHPDRMGSPNYYTGTGDSGGVHINSGVSNKAAFLMTDGGTFNGQTITGLGITKVARIYYEVNTNMLTSGSDYTALGNALNQGCVNLIGVVGITAPDCTEVGKAVTATEMVTPPPANDNFASAQTITGTSGTVAGSTLGATRQTGEPNHGGGTGNLAGSASVWYQFTAAGNGTATITTCNSGFDTLLGVYTGSAVNALTIVGNNDDASPACPLGTLQSRVAFNAVPGTTYRIAVDGYGTARGAVTLNWSLPAGPAPTGVSGTVTETGTGTPVGGAMVAVLRAADFAVSGGAVADGSGNFSAQVPAGTYYLYVVDASGAHVTGFSGPPTLITVANGSMTDHDPSLASRRGAISGTVSTDAPVGTLAGAWALSVNSSTGSPGVGTVANGSGQYTLANLPARSYWAVFLDPTGARRSEFFPNSSDATGASAISVAGGGSTPASVSLASQTAVGTGQTLSGTVTETGTGTPLAGAWVLALRASDFTMARGGLTNGSGQYSLNVATGTYKLAFLDPAGLHVMEWYDNQPNTGLATSTTVTAPQVANAALASVNGSVTGTVTDDVSNAPVANAWVFAIDANGTIAGGAVTAANGTYTVGALPAGPYRMTFVDPLGGRMQEYFDNSSDYAGATVVNVTGGGTASASAAMHHP